MAAAEQVNSIMRALDIIESFALKKNEYTLSELAKELSLPMSTVHRQLSTLASAGYITQDAGAKIYRAGSRMMLLGCSIVSKSDVRNVARPFLQKLSKTVEETVHLCQLDGLEMFYVDKIECQRSVSCISRIGGRLPAHATAAGKMQMAGQPAEYLERYCQALPKLPVYTPNTITDPKELRRVLEKIRRQGYAVDNEEIEDGLICVAAPLYNYDQQIIAAISVSGPLFRLGGHLDQFIPVIQAAARKISRLLGYKN